LGYILSYGPFLSVSASPECPSPFEYHVFIHCTDIPTDDYFRIAYGNPPFFPIRLLRLENEIDSDLIATLTTEQLRLIIIAVQLLKSGHTRLNDSVPLRDVYLTHPTPSPNINLYGPNVFRFPNIEILLSLATSSCTNRTVITLEPFANGIAKLPRQFSNPQEILRPSEDANASINLSANSSPSSFEWEEVSRPSLSPVTGDTCSSFNARIEKVPKTLYDFLLLERSKISSASASMDCTASTQIPIHIDNHPQSNKYGHHTPNAPHLNCVELPTITTLSTTPVPVSEQPSPSIPCMENLLTNHATHLRPPTSSVTVNDDTISPTLYNQPAASNFQTSPYASTAEVVWLLCNQITTKQTLSTATNDSILSKLPPNPFTHQPTQNLSTNEPVSQNHSNHVINLFSPASSVNADDELDIYASDDDNESFNVVEDNDELDIYATDVEDSGSISSPSYIIPTTLQPSCTLYRPVDREDEDFVTALLTHITSSSSTSNADDDLDIEESEMEIECTERSFREGREPRTQSTHPQTSTPRDVLSNLPPQDFISETHYTSSRHPDRHL
jgi:hypothetical protein